MDCSTIASMLTTALTGAQAAVGELPTQTQLHRARSRAWVRALAAEFRRHYSDDAVRVFTQSDPDNRPEFGCNELLHDITVVRTALVAAPRHKKELRYIDRVLWQVESEFARNGREALYDFNKLVLGGADAKLFVMPDVYDQDSFLRTLLAPATACTGQVYTARVPHPDRWETSSISVRLWELDETQHWREYEAQ
jgi:hypothetical protein